MPDDMIEYETDGVTYNQFNPEAVPSLGQNSYSPLQKFIDSTNIAEDLDQELLDKIGRRCHEGYTVDEKSRQPWLEQTKSAIELATQISKDKSFPWRGAANIKLPTITDAAVKFAARAYSEIIRDNQVVKAKVVGDDSDEMKAARAERVSDYMSWQLMEKELEWEPDTDKLLHLLPITGHMFRKRYWHSAEKRTKSELCLPDSICINIQASSIESCRRITHIIKDVTQNDVVSNQRSGTWLDVELRPEREQNTNAKDHISDEDYYCFYEQCCWLDLDDDGYEEPYIVTFERESMKVVRIVANYSEKCIQTNGDGEIMSIKPKCVYTDYIFIPALDGGYYGTGFGQMLEPLTRTANTLVNQIADSGSLNNLQAGYLSREIKIKSGNQRFQLGEWKRTEATAAQLQSGVFPLPTKEPSPVLFNLLGLMMDLMKDLSSVKDVLAGDSPGSNIPATTVMALIEQGMKTFNAIYKRIYRSLKKEYKQLYYLNYDYLDDEEYYSVLDTDKTALRQDFETDDMDLLPVADPNMSTDMQRLARAEALKGAIGLPGVDPRPIIEQWLEAMRIPQSQIDQILPEQDPNGVPPQVQAMIQEAESKMADIQIKEQELALRERELQIKAKETEYKAFESMTKAIKNLADAESAEQGSQLAVYKQFFDQLTTMQQQAMDIDKTQTDMLNSR
jgi:chaperonin GroES